MEIWDKFKGNKWKESIDVSDFIINNYTEYKGDESFLVRSTDKTNKVWDRCKELIAEELKKGVLDVDTVNMSGIDSFEAGYIDKDNEVVVGLQTDAPLKRMINPYGGIRMVYNELDAYGYKLDPDVDKKFNEYRKTHNQGVFDAFLTPLTSMHFFARNKTARKSCAPHGLTLGLAAKRIYRNESDVLTGAIIPALMHRIPSELRS